MIGTKIRELRKKKGISQAEFAHRIGVTQGFISMTENNFRIPSSEVIETIAKELEVDALELDVNNKSSSIAKLVSHLSGLTESQISILKEIAIQFKSNTIDKTELTNYQDSLKSVGVETGLKICKETKSLIGPDSDKFQSVNNGFIEVSRPFVVLAN